MKKWIAFFVLSTTFSFSAIAQKYNPTNNGVELVVDSIKIKVAFYSPSIVRILKCSVTEVPDVKNLAVIKTPEKVSIKIAQKEESILVESDKLLVKINSKTGQISYFDSEDKGLLQEKDLKFDSKTFISETKTSVAQSFKLDATEAIYGLGQHANGKINQRNQSQYLKQSNMQMAVPFFQSTKGYGLYWDNYSTTNYTSIGNVVSFSSEVGNCADYYFMVGSNADAIIANMRSLTGQSPMFPRWTYGFWQSRERYKTQYELLDVVKKYRSLHIPLDGIIQDWQYWGVDESNWNSTEFGNPGFPEPQHMVDSVHGMNAHIIISVWPSFGNKTKIFKELKDSNMLFDFVTWPINPVVQVYDPFNPKARDIYWKHLKKNIFSLGMDGWWMDATEPDQLKPKPTDDENKTFLGSFRTVRNAFPLMTTGGVYRHQREETSNKRVFILTRSSFAGQQRNATMTWSGDVQSRWDVFRNQIAAGLNLSLSGIPYWNSDIGGFFPRGKYPKGVKDPAFRELYVRWLEFGTFCPMMRSHGEATPREIYQFGNKGDWAFDAIEKFINFRYRLQPYIYSNAWEITSKSSTLMRALVMDFAKDSLVYNINNEYLFGKSILVTPVTDSFYVNRAKGDVDVNMLNNYAGKFQSQQVYLPKGADWVDFWTGEKLQGGQQTEKEVPIDLIPLYVKAGSIIPLGPLKQYWNEKEDNNLEIRIYEGADGQFTLYEDEGDNYNYEKGKFATINFSWNNKDQSLTIGENKGQFTGKLSTRTFQLVLVKQGNGVGISECKPTQTIKYEGKKMKVKF